MLGWDLLVAARSQAASTIAGEWQPVGGIVYDKITEHASLKVEKTISAIGTRAFNREETISGVDFAAR